MRGLSLLLVSTTLSCSAAGGPPPAMIVGKAAPVYAAASLTGQTVNTKSMAGRVLLLNVWATWCAPCRDEIPYLQQLHQTRERDGLSIVGVSVDAQGEDDKVAAFTKEMGMGYTIWRDPDERILTEYMAIGVPASYLIDRNGILRWKHVGVVRATDSEFNAALDSALAAAATQ
jgi:DsbE subfamily thiol:disulfide oxidoreductase